MIRPAVHATHTPHRQAGAVLIIGLVLLLALTLIGVTAMRGTTLEERMAGNLRDKALAFEAAEAGLRAAEMRIDDWEFAPIARSNTSCTSDCPEVWVKGEILPSDDIWDNALTLTMDMTEFAPEDGETELPYHEVPRFYIEEVQVKADTQSPNATSTSAVYYYRITARGVGGSPNAQSILQTTYARRF
jgi:type IV pilus assembly protein PilX